MGINLSWESRLIACHSCYDPRYNDYMIRPFPSMLCSRIHCANPSRNKKNGQPCVLDVSLLPETIESINAERKLIRNKKFKNETDIENVVKEFFN